MSKNNNQPKVKTPANNDIVDAKKTFTRPLVNKILREELSNVDSKSIFGMDNDAGWYDSNFELYRRDLTGTPYILGVFDSMRYNHPVIRSSMDFRRNQVSNLRYEIKPRCDDPDDMQEFVSKSVEYVINKMPYKNINSLVSFVYDNVSTYGFCFFEWIWDEEYQSFDILHIPASTIDKITLTDDYRYINHIRQNYGAGMNIIESDRLIWFGRDSTLGNYFGRSDLRALLMYFEAQQQAMQNLLQNQRNAIGIPYLQQTEVVPDENSYLDGLAFLRDLQNGRKPTFIASEQLKPEYLQAGTIDVDATIKFIEHSNDVIREATLSSLNSLGIGGSGGAYALGQELSVSDAKKFVNHVESFIELFNGNTNPHSCLLQTITACLGFDVDLTPEVCIVDTIKEDRSQQITTLISLVEKGILSVDEIGSENKRSILEDLGFSTEAIEIEEVKLSQAPVGPNEETVEFSVPKKYSHINFTPPKSVASAAKRGLVMREKYGRGGTEVGVARARDLSNRKNVSPETIGRMTSFFARHSDNKEAEGWNPGEEGYPSAGKIAHLLWGGSPGKTWAEKIKRQMDAADKKD